MPEAEHGGDIYRNKVKLDFSVSLNPLGMSKEVEKALQRSVPQWSAYPDPACTALRDELSSRLNVRKDALAFGNGAAELIYDLVFSVRPKKALLCAPAFSEYERALKAVNCEIQSFPLSPADDFKLNIDAFLSAITYDTDLVFLCNPNNPTGRCVTLREMREIEKTCFGRQVLLCVDECFVDLTDKPSEYSVLPDCGENKNICVLNAFTKTYALAGLRLGYLISYNEDLISALFKLRQPWNVSAPAQCAGLAALREVPASYLDDARKLITSERVRMSAALEKRGFEVTEGGANFIFFFSPYADIYERCLHRGILLRDCRNFEGLKQGYLRMGIHTPEEDDMLLDVLDLLI